ncbi:hypothetical protein Z517_09613 [Fonsecaea pedrosoi CBS 271.37]|uniref:Major facilitator superfamily (MFS) profile domain-containing protein n=1 Tax=Fonsecaea pedrosoi CBS 271.37 TaxID=1442368 RepID=A0A0D2ESE8_9EURO|nr:uncharacterized protein Z517_09613 [Fonsecaea pedrosoi CBS 271.37]KIW77167.1 hypothetical protein Z517_09613 [Fonsecaea pedrosoi CBS 271.37]
MHENTEANIDSIQKSWDTPDGSTQAHDEFPKQHAVHHTGIAALADIGNEDPENTEFRWTLPVFTNLFALYITWFVATFGNSAYASSLAYVARRFPESASQVGWVSTGPYVVATVLMVPVGEVSDLIGRKLFVMICLALSTVGALVAGRADSFGMIIGGQTLQGFGLVLCYLPGPLTQEMVPKIVRPIVAGTGGCIVGVGYIMSPIIEGVFIKKGYGGELEGWRTGYYTSAGMYVLALVCVLLLYHPASRPNPTHSTKWQRLMKIDWFGLLLLAGGLAMFLVGLSAGGITRPWTSASIISLLVIGGFCLVGLFIWNWKGTSEGMFPHCLFEHRNFGITLVVRAVGSFAQIGCQAYLPQLVVLLFTSDGVLQAVWQLPFSVSLIFGSAGAAAGLRLTREGRWIAVLSMLFLILGGGLLILIKPDVSFAAWFFAAAVTGFGIGCESQVLNIIAGLCTPDHLIATAIMVASLSGTFGGSIAITVFGQIYQSSLKDMLPKAISTAVTKDGFPQDNLPALFEAYATSNQTLIAQVPGMTPQILQALNDAVLDASAKSYHNVWYTLIAFAAITTVIAWFLKSTKEQLTRAVTAPVGERVLGLEMDAERRPAVRHGVSKEAS